MPHAQPRDEVVREGDGIVIDMGVSLDGYMSDLTRTIPVNGRFTKRQRQVYDAVLRVFGRGLDFEDGSLSADRAGDFELIASVVLPANAGVEPVSAEIPVRVTWPRVARVEEIKDPVGVDAHRGHPVGPERGGEQREQLGPREGGGGDTQGLIGPLALGNVAAEDEHLP